MEAYTSNVRENEKKQRGRFMGKLFKEPKRPTSEMEVEDFLHGPSDKIFMVSTNIPNSKPSAHLDTLHSQKTPTEPDFNSSRLVGSPHVKLKRSRKGLVVHFSDTQPELIGWGGESAKTPVIDTCSWKKAEQKRPHQFQIMHNPTENQVATEILHESSQRLESKGTLHSTSPQQSQSKTRLIEGERMNSGETGDQTLFSTTTQVSGNRSERKIEGEKYSFSQRAKDEMRSSEGMALVASRNSIGVGSLSESHAIDGTSSQLEELHLNTMSNAIRSSYAHPLTPDESSPTENPIENTNGISKITTPKEFFPTSFHVSHDKLDSTDYRQTACNDPEIATSVEEDVLNEFFKRTTHLSDMFRAIAEEVKPLNTCSIEILVRVGFWWFLKGRMNLEAAVRDKSTCTQAQTANFFSLYQAYTDLAKTLWVLEIARSRYADAESTSPIDKVSNDALEAQKFLIYGVRKLAVSMKRNDCFPQSSFKFTETQKLDLSFWTLEDGDKSLIVGQRLLSVQSISGSLPLGDTNHLFHYGRIFAEATLMEEGTNQRYRCPILLSITRNKKEKYIQAIVVNQEGSLNFAIKSDKSQGPTWADLKWYARKSIIEIQLPRGFFIHLQCSEVDFGTIWKLHDYEKRTYGVLSQRTGEKYIFETILKNLQYLDQSPNATFNNQPQPYSHMRVYEKIHVMSAATGPRTMHRGFRIAVVTSPTIKYLRGIDLELQATSPIEFSFLRGEGGFPAILLKTGGTASKCMLIATFNELTERTRLHALLTDVALGPNEGVIAAGHMKAFAFSTANQKVIQLSRALELHGFKFINQKCSDLQACKKVVSEKLRMTIEFRYGTITDRINVGPGELKLHLDPRRPCQLRVLRQPQEDWTILFESQAPRGSLRELEGLLAMSKGFDLIREYTFPSISELHLFQVALTGFEVIFDEVVTSLNISRRRMVVPIYKKWDAIMPRALIVRKEKMIQLVAFFENFSHGSCMNFVLRSTDIFESSSRGGKYSLRIVDAKFALPNKTGDPTATTTELDHEFVCLDMPEYPSEHDDISIHFDNEGALERFIKSLPAQVRQASRIGTVRR